MQIHNHLSIVLFFFVSITVSYLVLQYLIYPELTYHHQWQVRQQEEHIGSAILKSKYTERKSRTTYYTCNLEGKSNAPSFQLENDILSFETDSSLMDDKKIWTALLSVDTLSEIPIKWVIAKNGRAVFSEINGNRNIGAIRSGFNTILIAFLIACFMALLTFTLLVISFVQWIKKKE